MRGKKTELRTRVNQNLSAEFTESGLTSFAGLELLGRYLRDVDFNGLLRRKLGSVWSGGDYGVVGMCRLIVSLVILGGRRLRHVGHVTDDPMLLRFCGLRRLPTDRSVSRWLKRSTERTLQALQQLNAEIVARVIRGHLRARTLTIDVDGTVLCTGLQVEGARRGYNPHHRKVPSYYPITAFAADSGHVLRLENRPGNISDGSASPAFLQDLFRQCRQTLGEEYTLRCRMDGDYFKQPVFEALASHNVGYAIKVPFWRCLGLQDQIGRCRRWQRVDDQVDGFVTEVTVKKWKQTFPVTIYRKKVFHKTAKNYQLDLFDPNNGIWEYSAVASNLGLGIRAMWKFISGRGLHEKIIGELKTGLALDSIPTHHYHANSAWQQLVVLAHNLLANFQIESGLVQRNRTPKSTARWALQSVSTLRFELFNRAGRFLRPAGKAVLRMQRNDKLKHRFLALAETLKKVARFSTNQG